MITKTPFCADLSHWKEVPDWSAISPRPFLVLTKASEGVSIVDSKFIRFMDGMKSIGCHRGLYHFHRKALSPLNQADFFCNTIRPYIDDETLLALDVEEGGESAAALQTWFNGVRAAFPRNRVLLYSRRDILEQMTMTAAQKEFFKQIPVWTAGYPTDPDRYDYVPSMYMPDPSRFGGVVLWQYSAHGAIQGIVGDCDMNWISPAYAQLLGGEVIPPEPSTGGTMLYGTVIATATLNIRSGPGLNYLDIGDLHNGDKLVASDNIGGWWKLVSINGVTVATTETYAMSNAGLWIRQDAAPAPVDTVDFVLTVQGFKTYSGKLEKA